MRAQIQLPLKNYFKFCRKISGGNDLNLKECKAKSEKENLDANSQETYTCTST